MISQSSSYSSSDFGTSNITSDESAGIYEDVRMLKSNAKVKVNKLLKIIEVRDLQLNQYKKQIQDHTKWDCHKNLIYHNLVDTINE